MAEHNGDHEPTRRDVLYVSTTAVGAVGAAAAVWPLVDSMRPDARTRAMASIDVPNLDALEPGQQAKVLWRGKPVFIRRQTETEIAAAQADDGKTPDELARNENIAADADASYANRHAPDKPEWLVMVGLCTHLGCVPTENAGDFTVEVEGRKTGGWYCPCHGSHYDTAGRIRRGPAPRNLEIPPFEFLDDATVKIG